MDTGNSKDQSEIIMKKKKASSKMQHSVHFHFYYICFKVSTVWGENRSTVARVWDGGRS